MMLFAEVILSTEAVVVITGLVGALAAAVTYLFRLLLESKDKEMKEMESQRDSYKEISYEAVSNVEKLAAKKAKERNVAVPKAIASVVPEHTSPTTKKQREAAELQTIRARLTASTLLLDLPAREPTPAMSKEEEKKL